MIVRENGEGFVMITQHHHALLSEYLFKNFQTADFPTTAMLDSLQFAIKMHDIGWEPFDKEPFWDDERKSPFSFISFPHSAKAVLYEHGINAVEKTDAYASLLCSKHYYHFLEKGSTEHVALFLQGEKDRQNKLIDKLQIPAEQIDFHFELLQLFDNLSLFLCLNEPGTSQENTHYFFKKGVRIPTKLQNIWGERFNFEWIDEQQLTCTPYPFKDQLKIEITEKTVTRDQIARSGLMKSYHEAEKEVITFYINEAPL